eukprot:411-Eustigmatos_ZCMA.PRE.1
MVTVMLRIEQRDGLRRGRCDGRCELSVDGRQRVVWCGMCRRLLIDQAAKLGDEFRRDRQPV